MTTPTRTFIHTAQVRAADLVPEDHILLRTATTTERWRELFDVHTRAESVLRELSDESTKTVLAQARQIRLDTFQSGSDGARSHLHATPRPGTYPVIIEADTLSVSVHPDNQRRDPRPSSAVAPVRSEALAYALLETGEYAAVRFVRDETDDGEQVEDGWAIFQRWQPVTIQSQEKSGQTADQLPVGDVVTADRAHAESRS